LLVGVPHTDEPGFPDLPGTRDDVRAVADLLTRNGFDSDDVDARGEGCTVDELTSSLESLRARTGAGDLSIVYFTGHGYRELDQSPTPDEEYDQFLVLTDGVLRDDWFRPYWEGIAEGSRWVTFADCCFAGTVMVSFAEPPPDLSPIRTVKPPAGTWRLHLAATPDDRLALALKDARQQMAAGGDHVGRRAGKRRSWEPEWWERPQLNISPFAGRVPASYATAAVLTVLDGAPDATYRETMLAVREAANTFLRNNVRVGKPVKLDVSVDDQLLDSPAFSPLTW